MPYLITNQGRIDTKAIVNWAFAMDGTRLLTANGVNGKPFFHHYLSSEFFSLYWINKKFEHIASTLVINCVDYVVNQAEVENRNIYLREITGLFYEMIEIFGDLKPSKEYAAPKAGSLKDILTQILQAEYDAYINISGIKDSMSRVEAVMTLRELRLNEPISITIRNCYPKNLVELTYNPAHDSEQ